MKTYIRWAIFILIIVGSVLAMTGSFSGSKDKTVKTINDGFILEGDIVKGNKDAKVVLVEYSDFQCPACAYYHEIVNKLNTDLGDKVAFVYRNFPLKQIHFNAEMAAYTAVAAGLQNKFWEMHDLLFQNQTTWSSLGNPKETFLVYASQLGLDLEKFKTDLDSREVKNKVADDYKKGMTAKITGTPTFFLNGKQIENERNYENFKALIEKSLNETVTE